MSIPQVIKLVVIGDLGVGKTSILMSYASTVSSRSSAQQPSLGIFNDYQVTHQLDGKVYSLNLWDVLSAIGDYHDPLRALTYLETDIFLLCFSLIDVASYENVRTKWRPEVMNYCPDAAIVLVGTKKDLRDKTPDCGSPENVRDLSQSSLERGGNENEESVMKAQGIALAKEINAGIYLECSAVTGEGVSTLFREGINLVVTTRLQRGSKSGPRFCVVF